MTHAIDANRSQRRAARALSLALLLTALPGAPLLCAQERAPPPGQYASSGLFVAPNAQDAQRAARTGYSVQVKLWVDGVLVGERSLGARANEPFGMALEQHRHWRLQLAAAPAGAGRIRVTGRVTVDSPAREVGSPDLVVSPSQPVALEVGSEDGSSRFKAELVFAETGMAPPPGATSLPEKRLSPDIRATPLVNEAAPEDARRR